MNWNLVYVTRTKSLHSNYRTKLTSSIFHYYYTIEIYSYKFKFTSVTAIVLRGLPHCVELFQFRSDGAVRIIFNFRLLLRHAFLLVWRNKILPTIFLYPTQHTYKECACFGCIYFLWINSFFILELIPAVMNNLSFVLYRWPRASGHQ